MGKASRDKGKRGQREFRRLLKERDWTFMESRAGAEEEDILAISPDGRVYAVEVKNCLQIALPQFLKQAKEQAQRRGKHVGFMLACGIHGFRETFLVITATGCEIWKGGELGNKEEDIAADGVADR